MTTTRRWVGRYRELGEAGMYDRSSQPYRSPRPTPTGRQGRIIKVRVTRRWGAARTGFLLGIAPSTVGKVLRRYRMVRLVDLDRATGRVIRRYEHGHAGGMVHVDIKKLGNIPDGGGHKRCPAPAPPIPLSPSPVRPHRPPPVRPPRPPERHEDIRARAR